MKHNTNYISQKFFYFLVSAILSLGANAFQKSTFVAETGTRVYYEVLKAPLQQINIGLGYNYGNAKLIEETNNKDACILTHGTNGPLVKGDGSPVGGWCNCICDPSSNPKCQTNHPETLAENCTSRQKKSFLSKAAVNSNGGNFSMRSNGYMGHPKDNNDTSKSLNAIFTIDRDFKPKICMLKDSDCDQNTRCDGQNKISPILAFQNGPVLLYNGENFHNKHDKSRSTRSGMGWIGQTNTIIYINAYKAQDVSTQKVYSGVTYRELTAAFENEDALNAVYLDGADSYAGAFNNDDGSYNKIVGNTKSDALKFQFYDCQKPNQAPNARTNAVHGGARSYHDNKKIIGQ